MPTSSTLLRCAAAAALAAAPALVPGLAHAQAAAPRAAAPRAAAPRADTLRAGAAPRRALRLASGVDSSDTYVLRAGQRRLVMTYVEETASTPDGYLIVGRNVRPDGTVASLDSVVVARGTLAPVRHSDVTPAGRTDVRFTAGRMRGALVDSTGTRRAIDAPVPAGVYDYSMASRVVNLLPLRVGYRAVLPSYDIHRGAQFTRVGVLAAEDVEVRGRRVPAWKVEMDYGRFKATRWIDRGTRRDLRTTVNTGATELAVEHR
jgi:hypothetical protein